MFSVPDMVEERRRSTAPPPPAADAECACADYAFAEERELERQQQAKASAEAEEKRAAEQAAFLQQMERSYLLQHERCKAVGRTERALARVSTAAHDAALHEGRRLQERQGRERLARTRAEAAQLQAAGEEERAMLFGQAGWEKAMTLRLASLDEREAALSSEWGAFQAVRDAELLQMADAKRELNSSREQVCALLGGFVELHPALTKLCKKAGVNLEADCPEWQAFVALNRSLA